MTFVRATMEALEANCEGDRQARAALRLRLRSICGSRKVPLSLRISPCRSLAGIDIVVNNAGATKRDAFLKLTDDDWLDGFALKFFGAVRADACRLAAS